MNHLSNNRRAEVIRCLLERRSLSSTVRSTGIAKNTIAKLIRELGALCTRYTDEAMRNLHCGRIRVSETWSFAGPNEKEAQRNRSAAFVAGRAARHSGDVWTWTAMDTDTRLVPCWMLGGRDANAAAGFREDIVDRLAQGSAHLEDGGGGLYLTAKEPAIRSISDSAILVERYGKGVEARGPVDEVEWRMGQGGIEPARGADTERSDISLRMALHGLPRLVNGFSKKVENHAAAVGLYFTWYNFGRFHPSLGTTPAMKADVTDHIWSIDEILALMDSGLDRTNEPIRRRKKGRRCE